MGDRGSGAVSPRVQRHRSKTGTAGGGSGLLKPNFFGATGLARRSSFVASVPESSQLLEYVFCLAGDEESVVTFLGLLFDSDSAFAAGSFSRDFERRARPDELVRVSLSPLIGYGGDCLFDDTSMRKCEGLIFVCHVRRDLAREFRKLRKRIGGLRSEAKVMLVAFDDHVGPSVEEASAKDFRVHELKILAGNYGATFKEVGTSTKKLATEAAESVSLLLEEVIGGRSEEDRVNNDGTPKLKSRTIDVAFVGDLFVGKTALVQKMAGGQSVLQYTHTTVVNSHSVALDCQGQSLKLNLVDTPSVCKPADVATVIQRETLSRLHAYVFVFSVRNKSSFLLAGQLVQMMQAAGSKLPMLLVGTNADEKVMRVVSEAEIASLCSAMQVPFIQVCCHDDASTMPQMLAPLLERVLEADQKQHLTTEPADGGESSPGEVRLAKSGILYLREGNTKKRADWMRMQADLKRDLLILQPASDDGSNESSKTPTPTLMPKEENRRFSGILSTIRRLKSSSGSGSSSPVQSSSPTSRGSGATVSFPAAVTAAAAASDNDDEMRTVLLTGATVVSGLGLNADTGRFAFSVVDLAGKTHEFEVADTAAKRDEWVTVLKAASKTSKRQEDRRNSSSPSMISSGTLGRRRGKTFAGLTKQGLSTRNLFE